MLPQEMELEARLALAKKVGFEGVEPGTLEKQAEVRALKKAAANTGVAIAVENVWNRFLLSPVEFQAYVDAFKSPWVKAYFDVGNILMYGVPQHWIRTLGRRIARIHVKDFDLKTRQFMPLRQGSVNWPAVRKALADIRYTGWLTAEVAGGDEAVLRGISEAMDKIIAGE